MEEEEEEEGEWSVELEEGEEREERAYLLSSNRSVDTWVEFTAMRGLELVVCLDAGGAVHLFLFAVV